MVSPFLLCRVCVGDRNVMGVLLKSALTSSTMLHSSPVHSVAATPVNFGYAKKHTYSVMCGILSAALALIRASVITLNDG